MISLALDRIDIVRLPVYNMMKVVEYEFVLEDWVLLSYYDDRLKESVQSKS